LKHGHPVDLYMDTLRSRGIFPGTVSFGFNIKKADSDFCDDFLKQNAVSRKDIIAGILPLAAWPLKSWPIAKWNELAENLSRRYGIKILSLGKMPDNDLGRRAASEISRRIIPADKTTLSQAKALLGHCRFFIGPDSSLLHLASCMGVETIGLYGATAVSQFYPYFHRHNIIQPATKLPCMPCYPGRKVVCCENGINRDFGPCMEDIPVENVLAVIKERLNNTIS
jgi:ADP-heptose:LPS heptosyltransferase